MPAEAGLEERAISFTKGCYPGQEPVARLHYRGHANRGVRGVRFVAGPGERGAPVTVDGAEVGRVTSAVASPRFGPIGLAILRREVAEGAEGDADGVALTVAALPLLAATSPTRRPCRPRRGWRRRRSASSARRWTRSCA